jgi:RND family efflux transporter MFP subunit
MKKFLRWCVAAIIILVVVILITMIHRKHAAALALANRVVPVSVITPELKTLSKSVSVLGSVFAKQDTYITPKNDGYIKMLLFKEGQHVNQGDPVILLDNTKARSQLLADQTTLTIDKNQFTTDKNLLKKGLISADDLASDKSKFAAQQAVVVSDQKSLQEATLRAPFSGYLGAKTVSKGDAVKAAQQLVQIVDRDHLYVQYALPAKQASFLKLNESVVIESQAVPGLKYDGIVTYVSPAIDSSTRTITVHATITKPNKKIIPGQYAMVDQKLKADKPNLFVPERALLASLKGHSVMVVNNQNVAKQIPIVAGQHTDGYVEVVSGLNLDDKVIVAGQHIVKPDHKVKIVKDPEVTS